MRNEVGYFKLDQGRFKNYCVDEMNVHYYILLNLKGEITKERAKWYVEKYVNIIDIIK